MKWAIIGAGLAMTVSGVGHAGPGAQSSDAPAAPLAASIPAPAAGKGQVVFFRKGGIMGAAVSCAIHEHGAKISSLPPGKFAVVAADPGAHDYSVQSEATDMLHIAIAPGQTAYAQCSVGMGLMAGRPHLKLTEAADFQKMQAKLKPVATKP